MTDDPHHAVALDRVRARLKEAGATDAEIDPAIDDDVLALFTVDELLVPSPRRYTQQQVAEQTGMSVDLIRRFWRALGFLDVPEEEPAFTDMDIRAVRLFQGLLQVGVAEIDTALQMARVIGSSMSRIADAEVSGTTGIGGFGGDSVLAAESFVSVADATVPAMAWLLEFVWRRHVQAATRRTMVLRQRGETDETGHVMAVGFADMVGFTLLSQHLTQPELAAVVRRFDELSHDIVTGLGGRVVKTIGDEVMFVVDDVVDAARITVTLAEAYADDELLSDVRVGLAVGPVLIHEGDYFGPPVNLAHRIVNIANPGAVVMADDFRTRLVAEAGDEFVGQPMRPRVLKDLGRVQLWRCRRASTAGDGSTREEDLRRNTRWERLGDVLRDLEELRDVGERLFTGGGRGPVAVTPAAGPVADRSVGESEGGDPEGP